MSISLKDAISSKILTGGVQDLQGGARDFCFSVLQKQWRSVKANSHYNIQNIMRSIEDSVVASGQAIGKCGFTWEKRDDYLESKVDELFRKLAEKFGATFGDVIPVDLASYDKEQKKYDDEALLILWNKEIARQLKNHAPQLKSPNEIRNWLTDPANAPLLARIHTINLPGLGIKTIPLELAHLTHLENIFLSNNQIPSFAADLFSGFPKLQKLYLNNNRIESFPAGHFNFPSLECLSLRNNQISSFPSDRFHCPQLQYLYLTNNQILEFSESIFDNYPLLKFDINSNPLLFLSDKEKYNEAVIAPLLKSSEFNKHECRCIFSAFVQLLASGVQNSERAKNTFEELGLEEKRLILEMVFPEAKDPMQQEHLLFNDWTQLCHGVRKAISAKFDRLSSGDQDKVHEEIDRLIKPERKEALLWNKERIAFDNVLLLLDVIYTQTI